MFGNVLDLRH